MLFVNKTFTFYKESVFRKSAFSQYLCAYLKFIKIDFMSDNHLQPLVPKNIEQLNRYIAGKTIAEVKEAYNPDKIAKLASNENRLGCSPKVEAAILDAFKVIQDYPDPLA